MTDTQLRALYVTARHRAENAQSAQAAKRNLKRMAKLGRQIIAKGQTLPQRYKDKNNS